MTKPTGKPRGRPTLYSDEMVDMICEEIAVGKALHQLCQQDGWPSESAVNVWLNKYPDFQEKYARARARQQDRFVEEIVTIADDPNIPSDKARVMIDARKWVAGKIAPKKYGDKVQTEISGPGGGPVKIETNVLDVSGLDVEELEALEKALTATIRKG